MKKWTTLTEVTLQLDTSKDKIRNLLHDHFRVQKDYKIFCANIYVHKKAYKLIKKIYKVVS